MASSTWVIRKLYLIVTISQLLLLLNVVLYRAQPLYAQSVKGYIELVRFIEADELQINDPASLLFVDATDTFLVASNQTAGGQLADQTQITAITPYAELIGSITLPMQVDPHTMAFDSKSQRLYFFDTAKQELLQFALQNNGLPASTPVERSGVSGLNGAVQGLAVAPDGQSIYLLETSARSIRRVALVAGNPAKTAGANIDLRRSGVSTALGLAIHPQTKHIFTVDPTTQTLYELTTGGALVAHYDLSELQIKNPQGLVFAPSGDQTDAPEALSLYITDQQLPNQTLAQATNQNNSSRSSIYLPFVMSAQSPVAQTTKTVGRIAEVSFDAPFEPAIAASITNIGTVVRTVKTSEFSPSSPDPSGIAYISTTPYNLGGNRLLIVDGEVDEMPIYAGANLFETTLTGILEKTYTSLPLTPEPVGAAFNPNNGHLFISQDDGNRPLLEFDPGPDKVFRTNDDIVTSLNIKNAYGSTDPEGIEYARIDNADRLFIADGLNSEVYVVQPGANGKFDGIDDQFPHFDTLSLGVKDPEGIAYHPTTGTIYIVGSPKTRVAEITTAGVLVRYIDIAAAKAIKPAGLAFGPGSENANQWNLYIVDRNIDNNSDPNENDGLLYEIALPGIPNQPPTVDAGINLTVTLPAVANLDGTVADDGQPSPPVAVTVTWSKVSGPGTATFGNLNAIDTTAAFALPGDYVLRLTATDSLLSANDTMTVTVKEAINQPPTVNAGIDQLIELSDAALLSAQVTDDGLPNPPSTVIITWEKVSGPGTVSFANPNNPVTAASFGAVGTHILRIVANDGLLMASDELTVTVDPSNTSPTVEAGVNQLIGRADPALLSGVVNDDGLPTSPGQVAVMWSKTNGPGVVAFNPATNITTTATFSAVGVYVLRLTATDGAFSVHDEVTITVGPPNQAPTVDAGANQIVELTETVILSGSVVDDGVPNPPGAVTVQWTVKSGQINVTFGDIHALQTSVQFTQSGTYVLELTASDGKRQASDTVTIIVSDEETPVIIVGQSQTINLSESIVLSATAAGTWASLPPDALQYTWSKLSGPGNVALGTPQKATTTASFNVPGVYVIQITLSDGTQTLSETVTIMVNGLNQAPTVSLGADQFIPRPGTLQLTGTIVDDGLPSTVGKVTTQWSMVNGPASVLFDNATNVNTSATFTVSGVYVLKLTANDGESVAEDTMTVEVGNGSSFSIFLPLISTVK